MDNHITYHGPRGTHPPLAPRTALKRAQELRKANSMRGYEKLPVDPDTAHRDGGVFEWLVIIVAYACVFQLLRWIASIYTTGAVVLGLLGVIALTAFWCRERYNNALADRRAGIR